MTAIAIIAFLVGAVLAQRFRIFILLPLLLLAGFAGGIAIVMTTGADAWHFVLIAIIAAVSLQIGYLVGAAIRAWELFKTRDAKPSAAAADKPKSSASALPVH